VTVFARVMAARSDPGPLSLRFVTVITCGTITVNVPSGLAGMAAPAESFTWLAGTPVVATE
jgi:hypothetical protein